MSSVELAAVTVAFGSVIVALIAIILMRSEKEKPREKSAETPKLEPEGYLSSKAEKSVTHGEVEEAKNKLRIFSLEREILSYAIRRLYEAQAEGKITEEERDRLSEKYKEDMRRINEEVSRGESIIALNELERTREDLLKLFSERFDNLNKRIDEMRVRSGIEPLEPIEVVEEEEPVPTEPSEKPSEVREKKRKEPTERKPVAPEKSEAERKVEQIMDEVEKALAKLEQMEVSE